MATDTLRTLYKSIILIIAVLAALTTVAAPINYDESIAGDLLGGQNQLGTLETGINTVTGSISGSVDSGDRWDLTLPSGHEIHQINYSISNFSAVTVGDRGIFAFSNFVPASLTTDGSFSWPVGLPFGSPLTLNDHFVMRSFQQSGEEVSFDYVIADDGPFPSPLRALLRNNPFSVRPLDGMERAGVQGGEEQTNGAKRASPSSA
ncbi:MAG: hypothetical protein IIB09_00445 [Bacteroidetes bacterium]|nr:hypothetical protein [Bacteroidota bacterium]